MGCHSTDQHTQVPDDKKGEERQPEEIMARSLKIGSSSNNKQQLQDIQEAQPQGE